jgi:peptidoglycan/LPS O-acetylase OafA/YrhL
MFPLNGPSWSLFFEYIGNIMYALFLRRLPTKWLKAFVAASGLGYAAFAILNGSGTYNMGVGWTMAGYNFMGGLLRMTFAFSAGLLLSRDFKPVKIKGAFWICSALIIALLSVPYLGSEANPVNGVYDAICTILIFPAIVYLGASGSAASTGNSTSDKVSRFLGDLSYPLYIIHYPIMYLFYAWLWKNGLTFSQTWPVAVLIFIGAPVLAYACLKLYDEPVRRWLSRK